MPPPAGSSPAPYRSAHTLAWAVIVLLAIGGGVELMYLLANMTFLIPLLERIRAGEVLRQDEAVTIDLVFGALGLLTLVAYVITVVLFCMWAYRTNANTRALGVSGMQYTPGWTVGWFFIPIMNLYRPYLAFREMWRANDISALDGSADWRQAPVSPLLGWWWGAWLLSNFVGWRVSQTSWAAETPDQLLRSAQLEVFSSVVAIASAALAVALVYGLHQRQEACATRTAGPAPRPVPEDSDTDVTAELEARTGYVAILVSAASANGAPRSRDLDEIRRVTRELFASQGFGDGTDIEAVVDDACRKAPGPADAAGIAQYLTPQFQNALAFDVLRILYAKRRLGSNQRQWLEQYMGNGGIPDPAILNFFDREDGSGQGSRRQWLEELGLPEDADADAIKRAYRQKAREYHPDHQQHLPPQIRALAEAKMAAITSAYQNLTKQSTTSSQSYWFQPRGGGTPFPGTTGSAFQCACWLCGQGNRVPTDAEVASARCGQCRALLGMPYEYVQPATGGPAPARSQSLNVAWRLTAHGEVTTAAVFSPRSSRLLTAGFDQVVRVWDLERGQVVRELNGHEGPIHSAVFSPNGRYALSGSNDGTARLWEVDSGRQRRSFGPHGDWVHFVACSPSGHQVLTSSLDATARVWDVRTAQELARFDAPDVPETTKRTLAVHAVALSPDGLRIASGGLDDTARVWEVASGRELVSFRCGRGASILSIAFAPDGRHVLTGSADGLARLWDISGGGEVQRFVGHTEGIAGAVHGVSFSGDGHLVLTASHDGTARVWDVRTGEEMAHMAYEAPICCATFSPDGRWIATGHVDGSAWIWETPRAGGY